MRSKRRKLPVLAVALIYRGRGSLTPLDYLFLGAVSGLVFGASDPKAGACGSLYNLCSDPRLNHEVDVTGGVRGDECGAVLTSFFAQRRGE